LSDPYGRVYRKKNYSRKAMTWLIYMEQTDGRGYVTVGTGEISDCPNCHISAWTVTVRKQRPYMNLTVVIGTATHASRSATRLEEQVIN
jgi:hypothetical protein